MKKVPAAYDPLVIKNYLREFEDILEVWRLKDHNMVIGGVWALKLHGLVTRPPEDLDIIVYQPAHEFIDFIQVEKGMHEGSIPQDRQGNNWRSYKLTRHGLTINFIMEFEKEKPDYLLTYYFRARLWEVQTIDIVIEAKKSYNREKDLKDFEDFKRDNF